MSENVLFIFQQSSEDYSQSINNVSIQTVIDKQKVIEKEFLVSINNAFTYFENGDFDFFINENINIKNYNYNEYNKKGFEVVFCFPTGCSNSIIFFCDKRVLFVYFGV